MSLDVYLVGEGIVNKESKIYIREDGQTKEITIEKWNRRNPGREPVTVNAQETDELYWANITHNLGKMADEAGIYNCLWRPDENDIERASQLTEPLEKGLNQLKNDPAYFKQFSPENGWGNYELLVAFVVSYLDACKKYPTAKVRVSR